MAVNGEGGGNVAREGPGDSSRTSRGVLSPLGRSGLTRRAPQSSQLRREGWFRNVQRGQGKEADVLSFGCAACLESF